MLAYVSVSLISFPHYLHSSPSLCPGVSDTVFQHLSLNSTLSPSTFPINFPQKLLFKYYFYCYSFPGFFVQLLSSNSQSYTLGNASSPAFLFILLLKWHHRSIPNGKNTIPSALYYIAKWNRANASSFNEYKLFLSRGGWETRFLFPALQIYLLYEFRQITFYFSFPICQIGIFIKTFSCKVIWR